MPTPISTLVIKVASRCNLDCSYCYEYNMGDDSWRTKPRVLSVSIAATIGQRIREHCANWGQTKFWISFHGGEPLLAKVDHIARLVETIRTAAGTEVAIHFGMQSNAMLITSTVARTLYDLGLSVGVSLDGPKHVNDHYRITRSSRSSFQRTLAGIDALKSVGEPSLFAGILAVIDIHVNPIETYVFLADLDPPSIDFLLPHGNWARPPPGKEDLSSCTPYADWLIAIFDYWFDGNRSDVELRTFEEIIEHLVGGKGALETLGLEPVTLLTVGTDGDIEGVDTMKSVYPGAQSLGLNISSHSLDDALQHSMVAVRQAGADALCVLCVGCDLVKVCGAGYFPHRYAPETGFRNRSVYCADLYKLIKHIQHRIRVKSRVQFQTKQGYAATANAYT